LLLKQNYIPFQNKKITFSKKETAELAILNNGKFGTPQLVKVDNFFKDKRVVC